MTNSSDDGNGSAPTEQNELLNEILSDVRELEKKIKTIDVLPNWELGLKNDLLRYINYLVLGVSDFLVSKEAEA